MQARKAKTHDRPAIHALVHSARFTSPSAWRWEPHLSGRGFLVVEVEGSIEGALLVTRDASPVGWVRLAAVGDALDIGQWLDLSLPPLVAHLRSLEVSKLAWMDAGGWAGASLEARGFRRLTEVITLTKTDQVLPEVDAPPVTLRPASDGDSAALAAIDRRAFTPTWWRSEASVRRRANTASCFAVAEWGGEPVGYVECQLDLPTAHINRIAVDPAHQGRGIGAYLLRRALISVWHSGAEEASLNTQRSNHRSRRLYDRFGFEATGDAATVWTRGL